MTTTADANSWQSIHAELMRRIAERVWKPGDPVPHEVELAAEFGCARATVNRAMREIARAGFIERRRKAGTRVALTPVRRATLEIPVTRIDVESRGMTWRHQLIEQAADIPPAAVAAGMDLPGKKLMLHVRGLHFADGKPHLYEDRWINTAAVPEALDADFSQTSANEWLVQNAPFTRGDVALTASNATADEAKLLDVATGAALFVVERRTWHGTDSITHVRLAYAPGYRMEMTI